MEEPPAPPHRDGSPGRLTPEQRSALRHPIRRRIHETIHRTPSLTMGDLAGTLGVAWGTLAFHLRVLARVGLVNFRTEDGQRRVHPGPGPRPAGSPEALVLADPGTRAVAAEVCGAPGRRLSELAASLGCSPCQAHHHLRRLRRAGLVHPEPHGHFRSLHPAEGLARLLQA